MIKAQPELKARLPPVSAEPTEDENPKMGFPVDNTKIKKHFGWECTSLSFFCSRIRCSNLVLLTCRPTFRRVDRRLGEAGLPVGEGGRAALSKCSGRGHEPKGNDETKFVSVFRRLSLREKAERAKRRAAPPSRPYSASSDTILLEHSTVRDLKRKTTCSVPLSLPRPSSPCSL
jgi:hypothetical protein